MSIPCEAGCGRYFQRQSSLNCHLSMAQSCRWYLADKFKSWDEDVVEDNTDQFPPEDADYGGIFDQDQDDTTGDSLGLHTIVSQLNLGLQNTLPIPQSELEPIPGHEADIVQETTSGRWQASAFSLMLDDNTDERVTVVHNHAGEVRRKEASPIFHPKDQDGDTLMDGPPASVFYPFNSELDWQIAQWAIKDSPGQNALNRFLSIPGVVDKLGISWHNVHALHKKIDSMPDKAGRWQQKALSFKDIPSEQFHIWHRDPVEAIKGLWKDPNLSPYMCFVPSKVYTDATKRNRIYTEMWTAQWWHILQSKVNLVSPGGTVAPVIISTDKTQLTQFVGGKSAYPVYLTIGNIPKHIRRQPSQHSCVLIAYLSVDKINRSTIGMSDQEHRIRVQRVFHEAMELVLKPLITAGLNGVEMISSDGSIRDVFPILSCYAADYPEQCLVSCTKYGTCVKCRAKATELENDQPADPRSPEWTMSIIQNAKLTAKSPEGPIQIRKFHADCMSHDVAGTVYNPFWNRFPLCNIHQAIAPDVLHQLYQGVFKHLVTWCQKTLGAARLDARIRTLPPTYGVRHFKNGFSGLSQISGGERKNMAKILLGCLVGIMPKGGILAVAALLDFIYIAQYSAHNQTTLHYLEDALARFHQHRSYFIKVGVRQDFNIPKFHSLLHYIGSIKLLGTTDNYNTELFERLHIDFAKEGWRASNQRDAFPQMIQWLSRHEKVAYLQAHINSFGTRDSIGPSTNPNSSRPSKHHISIPKHPSFPKSPISILKDIHNAPDFDHYLKIYVNGLLPKPFSIHELAKFNLPFSRVHVYNQFSINSTAIHDDDSNCPEIVRALRKSKGHPNGRFDTVVVMVNTSAESTGLQGTRIGRVRVIFSIPDMIDTPSGSRIRPTTWHSDPLAFVEWYSPVPSSPQELHGSMYRIKKTKTAQDRTPGAIVPLNNIRQSCMLYPAFDRDIPKTWRSDNVLDLATVFYINNWSSKYAYQTLW